MAEAQKSDNTEQVEQLQKKLAALTKIHNSSKDAHLQLQDDLAAHQEAADKHSNSIAELEEQNRQLKEQIKSLDTQHTELVAECEKDEHRIHELENANTDLKHKLEIATACHSGQKSELQDVCDKLKEENKNLHQQLTEIDEKSAHKEKQ
jgi:chromosome segregation ATPase